MLVIESKPDCKFVSRAEKAASTWGKTCNSALNNRGIISLHQDFIDDARYVTPTLRRVGNLLVGMLVNKPGVEFVVAAPPWDNSGTRLLNIKVRALQESVDGSPRAEKMPVAVQSWYAPEDIAAAILVHHGEVLGQMSSEKRERIELCVIRQLTEGEGKECRFTAPDIAQSLLVQGLLKYPALVFTLSNRDGLIAVSAQTAR